MTSRDIIIAFISSVAGALVAWIVQQKYLNVRERRKEQELRTVKAINTEKIVTEDIFLHLMPGNSIDLMKEMLGAPIKYRRVDYPVFSEEEVKTNSYLYIFKNTHIKITSKDNESIDTLTVMPFDNSLSVESFMFPCETDTYKFHEVKVGPELIKESNHTFIQTRLDAIFAIEYSVPNPLYLSFTYFGFCNEKLFEYHKSKDPKLFIGGVIEGVCVSSSSEKSYFIHDYEFR